MIAEIKPRKTAAWLLIGWSLGVYAFLYLPILVLVAISFNDSPILSLPFRGVTLDWYRQTFQDSSLRLALWNSLQVAAAATLLATGLGLLAAFACCRYSFLGKNSLRVALNLPILLPGIVTGVAMLAYFSDLGWELSLLTVIIGHAVFGLPVAFGTLYSRLSQFPNSLAEAAADLGAAPAQVFADVIWPYIRSAAISAALLAFTLSFDEVVVTIFLTGRDNTLPMEIWGRLRTRITPEIAAVATLISAVSGIAVLFSQWVTSRDKAQGKARKS